MEFQSHFKQFTNILKNPKRARQKLALWKIESIPRYTTSTTNILGYPLEIIDSASFTFMYDEIFRKEIYKFNSTRPDPYIIDCGSNIGLSVIYFKNLFPHSKILAFEPDTVIFKTLNKNISNFNFPDVTLLNKAVWVSEEDLEFMAEGADSGRVVQTNYPVFKKYSVRSSRLKRHLEEPVDLLKIDIEGAETEVIQDCKDLLVNVKNLFVEYHSFANQSQTIHVLTQMLFEAGFRIHIHSPVISAHPFIERNTYMGMDMQLNIFAFRENHEVS